MPRGRALAVLAATTVLLAPTTAASAHETEHLTEVALRWHGDGGQQTVSGSLFGDLVVVPGDRASAVVAVRNDGPSDGTLAVSIVGARLHGQPPAADGDFADDLRINDIPASRLLDTPTLVHQAPVARGAVAEIPLDLHFPSHATSGNRGEVDAGTFAFDVHLRITGDGTTEDAGGDERPADRAAGGVLARTGGQAAPSAGRLLAGAGALLAAAALLARARSRVRARTDRR